MNLRIAVIAFSFVLATAALAQDPASLYKARCQVCHGRDGKGSAAGQKMGAKPFSESKATEQQFVEITANGKDKMPGFKDKLTDEQIKELAKYVRTLK